MLFLFGERIRSESTTLGDKECAVCLSRQTFTEQHESLWFTMFAIPLLKIEQTAHYWRCERCLSAYLVGQLDVPSHVAITKQLIVYTLLGYGQEQHKNLAQEICLKLTGFEISDAEYKELSRAIAAGHEDMVEAVSKCTATMNTIGKQQALEATFLTTYVCCDLQYEDRLRINLIGNALSVGLEFVDYCIDQTRKQAYYGVKRLLHAEVNVR